MNTDSVKVQSGWIQIVTNFNQISARYLVIDDYIAIIRTNSTSFLLFIKRVCIYNYYVWAIIPILVQANEPARSGDAHTSDTFTSSEYVEVHPSYHIISSYMYKSFPTVPVHFRSLWRARAATCFAHAPPARRSRVRSKHTVHSDRRGIIRLSIALWRRQIPCEIWDNTDTVSRYDITTVL